jgi:hypothetical protein
MKHSIISALLILLITVTGFAQTERTTVLENLEQSKSTMNEAGTTATLKSATRLFGEKDDLTAVIFVIPSGSIVEVLRSDSTYLYVKYDDTEGYIFNKNILFDKATTNVPSAPVVGKPIGVQEQVAAPQQQSNQSANRFSILENKYGTSMAARLYAGKIWKGMSTEMVKDSWGTPIKINRSININIVKEEWIFNNTWLFFENDRLIDWGPIKR